jgi:hypothetical protein
MLNSQPLLTAYRGLGRPNRVQEQYEPDWNREANQADGIAREPKTRAFPLKVETP